MTAYTVNYKNIVTTEIFDKAGGMTTAFLRYLSMETLRAAGNGNDFFIAMSGGSTPLNIFKSTPEGWGSPFLLRRMKFYWGDERCVPPVDEQSNYGNATRFWFNRLKIPPGNIQRVKGESMPEEEAKRYGDLLTKMPMKNGLPVFDLILLGIGEDGHTASIFPEYLSLFETQDLVVVTNHPESGQSRITITGRVINNARNVLFLVTGKRKSEIVKDIFSDAEKAMNYPAYHVRPAGNIHWYLDLAAAGPLSRNK